MFAPIIATKLLFPPLRSNLVHRPRLVERLAAGLRGPLTLVSAPPGSGKTTLLSEWRAATGVDAAVAWLSLDEADNDPAHFLMCLMIALDALQPGLLDNAMALLQAGQPAPPEVVLTSCVNALSARSGDFPDGVVLVLDDYHVISTPAVHDLVKFLVVRLPPVLHLVILSRQDPPLPLSKLRVRGQLTEIREGDLRFTASETAAFMAQTMGVQLSSASVASLVERTEGWAAALQIAGLSLRNQADVEAFIAAFRGDDRYVMDYLMDEVFNQQPPVIQDFLLQTSILARLCASLCDTVMGIGESANRRNNESVSQQSGEPANQASRHAPAADSQAILEHLERANLFIVSLDNRREWYRYHQLFADLLRYRLQRIQPEWVSGLHRRAARWYAQAGDPDEAMRHALAATDGALVADLAEQFLLQMTGSSRIVTYMGWLQQIPDEIAFRRAYLCVGAGWSYALVNQADVARRYVEAGRAALSTYQPVTSVPDGRVISAEEVAGNLAAIRSYVDRLGGDLLGGIAHAQEALAILPAEALAVRCAAALNLGFLRLDAGEIEAARTAFHEAFEAAQRSRTNVYVGLTALSQLGGLAAMRGQLREAESLFQRALRFGPDEAGLKGPIPGVGIVYGWLMWVHCQRNDLEAAQKYLDQLLQAVAQMGIPEATLRAYLYQARVDTYRGRVDQAAAWFARAEALMQDRPAQGLLAAEWIAFRGQFHLAQGDIEAVAELLEAQGVKAGDLDGPPKPGNERLSALAPRLAAYVLLARVLAARGESQHASALLGRVCQMAAATSNVEMLLQALALRAAIVSSLSGAADRGLAHLERALNLAAPEGFARPLLDAGSALVKPLRQAIMLGIQPGFAQKLLAELAEEERRRATAAHGPGRPVASSTSRLIEPLTERERQVLRLLAAGLSSNEVAGEMIIAVSTARSYMKSLYGKLDAHSREEAIEQGRQFGLL